MGMNVREHIIKIIENESNGIFPFFDGLKKYIPELLPDRVTIVGAYTGIGKTYAVVNFLNKLLNLRVSHRVLVVTTEMSVADYEARLIYLRAGLYENDLYNINNQDYIKLKKELDKYDEIKLEGTTIDYLYTNKFETIKEKAKGYDLVIIDYIQDLIVNGLYKPEDTMPVLSQELKALKEKRHVVCISQINNRHREAKLTTLPYAYGVELSRMIAHGLVLERVYKKSTNDLDREATNYILLKVAKNRYGDVGTLVLKINRGHYFTELDYVEKSDFEKMQRDRVLEI